MRNEEHSWPALALMVIAILGLAYVTARLEIHNQKRIMREVLNETQSEKSK